VFSEHASKSPLIPTWSDPLVIRAVATTAGAVAQRLACYQAQREFSLGAIGVLRVESWGCRGRCHDGEALHLSGRLVGAGPRLARFTRVDIEISSVSPHTLELRMLPRSRHIHGWGIRRQRRYFGLAHAAADPLQQAFTA
jgi:hypothetical protein